MIDGALQEGDGRTRVDVCDPVTGEAAAAPDNDADAALAGVYDAAVRFYEAGDDDLALEALARLEALAPPDTFYREHYYYFTINILGFRRSNPSAVRELAERATREFPRSTPLWFLMGRIAAELSLPSLAVRAFSRALKGQPDHLPAAYELAKALHLAGRARMASKVAARAIEFGATEPLLAELARGDAPPPPPKVETPLGWIAPPGGAESPAGPDPCRGVFLVVGSSYCGSTLLNLLLGAHPSIASGGELHWLIRAFEEERRQEGRCAFCRDACEVWTADLRASLHAGNLYRETARVLNKPFICDASKMPDWSRFMAPLVPTPRVRILLVKHPLRHVASFVEKARRKDSMSSMADIDHVLQQLANLYAWAQQEPVDVLMRYEDLVADPRAVLTPVLARFGLDYDPAMENWRAITHHQIGGNAGPRSQIAPKSRPTGGFLQRKYNRKDIFLDDSFAAILTPEEIDRIVAHPLAQAMCAEFGYEPRITALVDERMRELDVAEGEASLRAAPAPLDMSFEPYGGLCFLARMELMPQHRYIASVANHEKDHRRSTLVLMEDGRPLGPAHTSGNVVRAQGGGRYTHWKDVLIFSTPDNSDPNTNGRAYSIGLCD